MVPLAKALAPSYFRFGGTYSDVFVFNETLNGPINQEIPWALTNGFFGNKTTIFSGRVCLIFHESVQVYVVLRYENFSCVYEESTWRQLRTST
jgi:hypothetical protein